MKRFVGMIIGMLILVLGGIGIYLLAERYQGETFLETGNLLQNNPGMEPGVWYVLYEEPGQPAVSAALAFDAESRCISPAVQATCDPSTFLQGSRVTVAGTEKDGRVFVDTLTFLASSGGDTDDFVRLISPTDFTAVAAPLRLEGKARGMWYFEGSFPIKMFDANNQLLGTGIAQAQGEWMTESFVPFVATLAFTPHATPTGTLVLEKDNPSGLPEHADELRIPVTFAPDIRTVQLYYYNPELDMDASGNILCSSQGLVAVERAIPRTATPLQDAVQVLLQGALTFEERARGITTEFPLPDLALTSASLRNGHLTLAFADPRGSTVGGSCRVSILWAQISATAKQFSGVNTLSFTPAELFQP